MAQAVTATVEQAQDTGTREPPFTVSLKDVPGEHDGSSAFVFEVAFSKEPPNYSFVTLRDDTVTVVQDAEALVPSVKRLAPPNNARREVTVTPSANAGRAKADIAVSVGSSAVCGAATAVCADAESLSNTATATILGPAAISVADAEAEEAEGATVDFIVSLNREATSEVSVDYATANGTATAGEDYTASGATLVFAVGETAVHSTNVLIQSHILAGVKGSDCFCYLFDGKTLSAFGTRVGSNRSVGPWRS